MPETPLACRHCGAPEYPDPAPHERMVRDTATGEVYCAFCADELSRIVWGAPAVIREADGSPFTFGANTTTTN